MKLVHVKMKNGEDVVGYAVLIESAFITLKDPISITIDPHVGMFAKSWLMFSDVDTVMIRNNDIMFCYSASDKAITYYNEFMNRLHMSNSNTDNVSDSIDELESLFNELLESKSSTKH